MGVQLGSPWKTLERRKEERDLRRLREPFPLPYLNLDPELAGNSRSSRQRCQRRGQLNYRINRFVESLNCIADGGPGLRAGQRRPRRNGPPSWVAGIDNVPLASQRDALGRVRGLIASDEPCEGLPSPRDALQALLRDKAGNYGGGGRGSIAAYQTGCPSLPKSRMRPKGVERFLPPHLRESVENAQTELLRPPEEFAQRLEETDIKLYMDPILLHDETKYAEYLIQLYEQAYFGGTCLQIVWSRPSLC